MKNTAAARLILFAVLILSAFGLASNATAQDYSIANIPVIKPKPDFNGVDMSSGGYIVTSPFQFRAPGAGNLNTRLLYNSRKISFELNIYLLDETYRPVYDNVTTSRQLRVHVNGSDRLFICDGIATCVANAATADGAVLIRETENRYVLRDRSGVIYTFYDQFRVILPDCPYNEESGCNAAGYQGYAYVSTIQYPSGEKITYHPDYTVAVVENECLATRTISSNLGYKLEIVNRGGEPDACTVSVHPDGGSSVWWIYAGGGITRATIYLKKGTTLIGSVANSVSKINDYTEILTQRDHLGRTFSITLNADPVTNCNYYAMGGPFPVYTYGTERPYVPIGVTSPDGVWTTIYYHNLNTDKWLGYYTVPVKSVSRPGGRTWNYDLRQGGRTGTDALQNARSVTTVPISNGYDYGALAWGYCQPSRMGDRITVETNGLSHSTLYEYKDSHPSKVTLPEANFHRYTYDARYNVTEGRQVAKPGSSLSEIAYSTAGFDPSCSNYAKCNQPNWTKDGRGNQTDYTYDDIHGGLKTLTLPADGSGLRLRRYYFFTAYNTGSGYLYRNTREETCALNSNQLGLTSCPALDSTAVTVRTYWNSTFLPLAITRTDGANSLSATTTYEYDSAGRVTSVDGPLQGTGDKSFTTYDTSGRPVFEIGADPDGNGPLRRLVRKHEYNKDDLETYLYTGTGTTTNGSDFVAKSFKRTTYDAGRLVKIEIVDGSVVVAATQFSYDTADRLECTAIRMNPAVYGSLPASACSLGATSATYGSDRITRMVYDAAYQVTNIKRAVGTALEQNYVQYSYYPNGIRKTQKDANNNVTGFVYDGHDRLTTLKYPGTTLGSGAASNTDYESYSYDANGNRISWRRRDGNTIGYSFDSLNREILKDIPGGTVADVYTGYDGSGNIAYRRFGSMNGAGVSYAYDGLGRLRSTIDMNGRTLTYQYNVAGARKLLTWPDGVTTGYSLDNLSRMTALGWNAASGVFSQGYDDFGRITSLSKGGGATTYGFDTVGRLINMTNDLAGVTADASWTFSYNPAGQLVSQDAVSSTYDYKEASSVTVDRTYDGLNRDSAIAALSGGYDARRNLTYDGVRRFTYDIENRLLTATGGTTSLSLAYDPEGRLIRYTSGSTTTTFLYDGPDLIGEYNGSGIQLRRYLHGTATDDPLVWYEGAGNTDQRYFFSNHQGSIIAYTNSSGALSELYKYGPYGEPKNVSNAEYWNGTRFRYTGQTALPEAKLYFYKARVYDPAMGRFLQTDPVGYADDLNLYAYTRNDPLNNTDPTGKIIETGWDVANVVMDLASLSSNVASGNVVGAAVDVAGLVVDAAATVVPGVPGGAGAAIKAARGGVAAVNKGKEGVAVAKAALEAKGMTTAGSEITTKTAKGSTKFDLGVKDAGKNVGVEVKTGPTAKLNSNQTTQHGEINAGGANAMTGGNATNAGLAGQSVDHAVTVHVDNGQVTKMYCVIKPGGGC